MRICAVGLERGESYPATLGFFRQYELYYLVADELGLVRLRTNYHNDEGYLYRMTWSGARKSGIFHD
jgi:hypothetical protein